MSESNRPRRIGSFFTLLHDRLRWGINRCTTCDFPTTCKTFAARPMAHSSKTRRKERELNSQGFNARSASNGVPSPIGLPFQGVWLIGPVLPRLGSEAHSLCQALLSHTASADLDRVALPVPWCPGFLSIQVLPHWIGLLRELTLTPLRPFVQK